MSHGIPLSYAIGLYCLVTQKLKQKRPSLMKRKPPTFLVEILKIANMVLTLSLCAAVCAAVDDWKIGQVEKKLKLILLMSDMLIMHNMFCIY